jgi:alpha-L-rhamnosidase
MLKFIILKHSIHQLSFYSVLFLLLASQGCGEGNYPAPVNLTVDHLENPLGLENLNPSFSWQHDERQPDFRQTAWQIMVASSYERLQKGDADIWDSGKIMSSRSVHIPFEGVPLSSGQQYFWKVRTWDQDDVAGSFSRTGHWAMGLLEESDWQARWISAVESSDSVPPLLPAPYFRKEFSSTGNIVSARLYISGLGYYEAFINGQKVGDHVLDPMKTHYDRRVKYVTYDVDEFINGGQNALGVVLGTGWYNQHIREAWDFDQAPWRDSPKMLCQLVITGTDGKKTIVASDGTWRQSTGPILFDGVHNGETYDARLEIAGWNEPGFDDTQWQPVVLREGPGGRMSSQLMPPIRVIDSISPVDSWKINDSVVIYDLGQNITGWARIRVSGPAGSMVTLRYGERIYEDGTLDIKELSRFIWTGDTQTDRYILRGSGTETWHPVFTYHGFQYIEATVPGNGTELHGIQGHVVYTDLGERGYFSCSEELFNRIHENLIWSFLGNYHGYPTDCPHREKMGWTGDAMLVAETGLYNFDLVSSYLKWIDDFTDEQQPGGQLPGIIPTSGWGYTYGTDPETRPRGYGPQWEGAFMEIPWQMYRFTADTTIIERYYDRFKQYVGYLTAHSKGNLLDFGIDDHKQLKNLTFGDYLSSAFYYRFSFMLAEMAGITGRIADSIHYTGLSAEIRNAFNERYFDRERGIYLHGGQTPMAMALYFGIVDEQNRPRVLHNLLKVISDNNGHIDAGVVGTKAVINALLMHDQERVLYEMAAKRGFPGWGYWIEELGATTLFQNWDGSQSRNHIMFGSIGDYFYKGLAGINIDDTLPGFKNFIIRPSVDNDIEWVDAGHESPYGMIRSSWKKSGNALEMKVTVPVNSSAYLHVPGARDARVRFAGGREPDYWGYKNGFHIYSAEPGSYQIRVN